MLAPRRLSHPLQPRPRPVDIPIPSTNRGHIGASDALPHLLSADYGLVQTKKESGQWLSGSSVRCEADTSPESLGKNTRSICEHYEEMAAVEHNIREVEWRDLADTILVFVCINTL